MIRRKLYVWFIGLWLCMWTGSVGFAQQFDLKTYVERVKYEHPDSKQIAYKIKLAEEETKIAKSAILPNIGVEGAYQRDFNKNFLFINDGTGEQLKFRTNFNNSVSANVTLTQTVFDASVFPAIKLVKLNEELSKLQGKETLNELITQASSLYWRAALTKESIHVFKANMELAKDQFNQIKILYNKGVASQLQFQQTELLYKQSQLPLADARHSYNTLLNALKRLANIPVSASIELTDDLEGLTWDVMFDQSDTLSVNHNQLDILHKNVEIAHKQTEIKEKQWYPKLQFSTAYDYSGQDNAFRFSKNSNRLFFGQLGLSIPLFSGGQKRAELNKAKLEEHIAKIELDKAKRHWETELENAKQAYMHALAKIELHKEAIVLNQKEISIFTRRLSLGEITPTEFKESRIRLTQSRIELLNVFLDLHIAHLQITRITQNHY